MSSSALERFIKNVPKTETHLHIEGALPWELLQKLDTDSFNKIPFFRKKDFRYDSFEQFESILIEHAMHWFNSAESYYEAAKLIFKKHIEQNVKYVELSFHAGMIEFLKLPGEEILSAILDAVPDELDVRVFLGISRNAYTPYLGPNLERSIYWDNLSGIDLHGLESLPLESWTIPFWEKARSVGKIVKAHAGEFGPASNVLQAVKELKTKRVQHGTKSIEDDQVLKLLVDEDVTLDMCPISNYKLRVIESWQDHPIKEFMDKGIRCTVSTDDPLSFNNTLIDEYMALHQNLAMNVNNIAELVSNGIRVADLPQERKLALLNQVKHQLKEFTKLNG